MQGTLRILPGDDLDMLRTAIVRMIQESSRDWQVCGEGSGWGRCHSTDSNIKAGRCLARPLVAVTNAFDVATILRESYPSPRIVIMSEQEQGTLSKVSKEFGFECLPKSRLAFDLIPTLLRFSSQ
jgi:hypothetical protein